ncbi:MAG: DUF2288 family protein [Verrucomicrobiota bacterium]
MEEEPQEGMRYRMLGEDIATDAEKLEKYTGEVAWSYLKPHYQTGALLWVDPSLDLHEVGQAFIQDASEKVARWKNQGDLIVPSDPHVLYWESKPHLQFRALVVSPFVLMQPLDPVS